MSCGSPKQARSSSADMPIFASSHADEPALPNGGKWKTARFRGICRKHLLSFLVWRGGSEGLRGVRCASSARYYLESGRDALRHVNVKRERNGGVFARHPVLTGFAVAIDYLLTTIAEAPHRVITSLAGTYFIAAKAHHADFRVKSFRVIDGVADLLFAL